MTEELTQEDKSDKIAIAIKWKSKRDWTRESGPWTFRPDYFESLDAMHQAEEDLTPDQTVLFRLALEDICGSGWPLFHHTADVRAEAFGKALRLW